MHYVGDAVLDKFGAVVDAVSGATEIQKILAERNDDLADESKVNDEPTAISRDKNRPLGGREIHAESRYHNGSRNKVD